MIGNDNKYNSYIVFSSSHITLLFVFKRPELIDVEPALARIKGSGMHFMYLAELENLIRKLLVVNPVKRASSQDALSEIESILWIRGY